MRTIKNIFVHCTATPQHTTIEQLQAAFRRRGWSAPGYHYVICPTGRIVKL
ncbi:MAG: N-acetylmuramoyl-L-alanine amidase, partial [Bacteroidaceae bacterium]|nr:N-acetylmuramoyl-L-alanine amidase [Bacteroidaceae bacterium]